MCSDSAGASVAQFVGAEHVAFDAPAPLHRRFAAQPVHALRILRQHQAAFGADAEVLAGLGGDLLPQRDGARRERQRVRGLAAVFRRFVGEVVGQQLHVQAAGVRGAGGHAGFVAFGQQHVGAVAREDSSALHRPARPPPITSTSAVPCLLRQRRQRMQVHRRGGRFEQRRLELRRLEHQRRGGHRAQRRARCGERPVVRRVGAEPRDRGGTETALAAAHAGARRLLQRGSEVRPSAIPARSRPAVTSSQRQTMVSSAIETGRSRTGGTIVHSASWNASARASAARVAGSSGARQAQIARRRQPGQPAARHRHARAAE